MSIYIGLMSGTSFDGIDALLVAFNEPQKAEVLGHFYLPYPKDIQKILHTFSVPESKHALEALYHLNETLGQLNAQAVQSLLASTKYPAEKVTAIGMHGQTIRHFPPEFTVQLGNPHRVAQQTGIRTVADFRSADLCWGGQGAPLAPILHQYLFHSDTVDRALLNIGGFSNLSLLPKKGPVTGFDAGPGNIYLDWLTQTHFNLPFDDQGQHARHGTVNEDFLKKLLGHPYFQQLPPKSTGRDLFSIRWFEEFCPKISSEDLLATATALTVETIAAQLLKAQPSTEELFVCGGGALNTYLMECLQKALSPIPVQSTQALGIHPGQAETLLTAYLAHLRVQNIKVDLRSITGSSKPHRLGVIYE